MSELMNRLTTPQPRPAIPPQPDPGYGARPDGSPKGRGYFGELPRPDGGFSTEVSVGVNINGKDVEIPLLVPTLSKKEVDAVLRLRDDQPVPESIMGKAVDHARQRLRAGKSPFAASNEMLGPPR